MLLLLQGPDSYLAQEAITSIKEKYLAKNPEGVELIEIRADGILPNWADLLTVPLFATSRLVIVKEAAKLSREAQESLSTFLLTLPATTVAVVWPGQELKEKSSLQEALTRADKTISVAPLTGQKLQGWIKKKALQYGLEVDASTTQALLGAFENDLWALDTELRVLSTGATTLSAARKTPELETFALFRSVQQGRWEQAKRQLVQELRSGKPIELLVGSIASALRQSSCSDTEKLALTDTLIDVDFGLKTGWIDADTAVALLISYLPKSPGKRVEWEKEWEGIGA